MKNWIEYTESKIKSPLQNLRTREAGGNHSSTTTVQADRDPLPALNNVGLPGDKGAGSTW